MPRSLLIVAASLTIGCGALSLPAKTSPPRADGSVHVRVEAPPNVELWQIEAPAARVCSGKCESDVQVSGRRYEARVVDSPDSRAFALPHSSRGLVLKVEPAPPVLLGLGVVISTVGTAGMLIGGSIALGDALGDRSDLEGTALAGGITVAAGSAVLAAGLVLALLSGTSVQVREALREPAAIRF